MALNSIYAPAGCHDVATALAVPVTFVADCTVVVNYLRFAVWRVILRLLPSTAVGILIGTQLVGELSPAQAKILIGTILMGILLMNLRQELKNRNAKDSAEKSAVPAYADSLRFACIVGIIGGVATMLTNAMGPILNVFLLTLQFDPRSFVGTRSTFFTLINTLKLIQRLYSGTLSAEMLFLGTKLGVFSFSGVLASKVIVSRMSKAVFLRLEYGLMVYTSLKLIYVGLTS